MSKTLMRWFAACWLILVSISFVAPSQGEEPEGIQDALSKFRSLDKDYAPAPLWTWNDLMTEEDVQRQLREFKEQGVQQAFVHPRPGLMTTYLTDEWFRVWGAALKTAEALDMNLWIYDENSYPSGFAGGLVSEAMPEARKQGLSFRRTEKRPEITEDTLAVYLIDEKDETHLVTDQVKKKATPEKADYLIAYRVWGEEKPWLAGKFYVDLTMPGVTEKFLEITLDAYKKHFGDQFGKRIPGSFSDEPCLQHGGQFHWNKALPELFEKRYGYSLMDNLSHLIHKSDNWQQTRYDFYALLNELFVNNWCKKYSAYCDENNLEWTGHFWEQAWPKGSHVPDNMAAIVWQQRPGIDMLYYFFNTKAVNAEFGNVRSVKQVASVANQAGRKRTLCECIGASGWWMNFRHYKCYVDWIIALGVNTIDEHYATTTIRGARKYGHPPFFSYQEPWWKDYHVLAHYYTRLCAAMSSGKQINRVVILEPTTTMWMHQERSFEFAPKKLMARAQPYQDMVTKLEFSQAEFDLLSEYVLKEFGHEGAPGKLAVGQREYDLMIIPPNTENLESNTVAVLEKYLAGGGRVLCCSDVLDRVDGTLAEEKIEKLTASPNWKKATVSEAVQAAIDRTAETGLAIKRDKDQKGYLFHHRRQMDDGEIVFLVNTSTKRPASATLTAADMKSIQAWDAFSGTVHAYPATSDGKTLTARVKIPPCGSLLLALSKKAPLKETEPGEVATVVGPMVPLPEPQFTHSKPLPTAGPLTAKRLGPNVLTLDFADVTVGGETKVGMPVFTAQDWVFQKHGLKKDPWNYVVQWRDEEMKRPYAPDSGFTATYHFTIEGDKVPTPLAIVIECADRYEITCNGKPVSPTPGRWWFDRAFGVVDLSKTAHVGPNEVTIAMQPMTPYGEVALAYLLGDFTLEPAEEGFVVKADRPLAVPTAESDPEQAEAELSWQAQGLPFYSEGIAYEQTFTVPAADKEDAKKRYLVELPAWNGSVARVSVNGRPAGHILIEPWQCDVTPLVIPGENRVRVEVIGTLTNTLGPHHRKKAQPWCGPNDFGGCRVGPPAGEKYRFRDYGLWEPIQLKAVW